MVWTYNPQGYTYTATPVRGTQLEVARKGQAWLWYVYVGGIPYERGQADTLESAKAAAENALAAGS